jgi:hypothetical protein
VTFHLLPKDVCDVCPSRSPHLTAPRAPMHSASTPSV